MLATGTGILDEARANGRAVGAFSTYTLESTRAICAAAEAAGRPVILQVSTAALAAGGFAALTGLVLAAARACAVPVGVHLDHSRDLDEVRACLDAGFTSVMVDGSVLAFEDNVAFTSAARTEAHAAGAWIEAELGPIAGDEHASVAPRCSVLTDPAEAAAFVEATRVDVIAAAVGTAHGLRAGPAGLDAARIAAITAASGVGFALHGASGLTADELDSALGAGTVKVNFNTELRRAYLEGVRRALCAGGDDVTAVMASATTAITTAAAGRIAALEGRQSTREAR